MSQVLDFLGGMFGTRLVEIVAASFGLFNVILIMKRSIWNYPFGIAMVLLYAWIFFDVRLYSDAILQIFFLVIQLFGVYWWLNGRAADGRVQPINLPANRFAALITLAIISSALLGYVMSTFTNADLPYWDALTTILSVLAQFLMARRYVQSWLVWIFVDVLAIGIYLAKGLTPTAALYVIFLGLAIGGFINWTRSTQAQEPSAN